jgi:outer membrane immunogenic protein
VKSEYRASHFDRATLAQTAFATGLPTGSSETLKPFVQTINTSLVHPLNWGGPLDAK